MGALLWWWRSSAIAPDADPDAISAPAVKRGDGPTKGPARLAPALELLADPGGSIAGRVTASDGTPIAGADVCAGTQARDLGSAHRREPHCATTEHDGSYRITGLWRVTWGVGASKRGFIPAPYGEADDEFHGLRLDRQPEQTGIDFVLEPGGVEIKGEVKDLGGGEIEGALVRVVSGDFRQAAGAWGPIARTDAAGEFSLWAEDGYVEISAHADGYTSSSEQGRAPGMRFTVVLTPESVLAGSVRDTAGEPVPGATVSASGGTAISDENGRYRIDQLAPGRYKPSATADGLEGLAAESVRLGIGETVDPVDVIVHPVASVHATVTIEGAGPCPRGNLTLSDPKTKSGVDAPIEDGTAHFDAVQPGQYQVSVGCDKYAAADEYPDLEVKDEPITGLVYTVTSGRTIRGVIVDADGKGVKGASAYAQLSASGRGETRQGWDETDASGGFALEGLVPGTYALNVWAQDHPQPKEPVEVVVPDSGEAEDVRIVLEAGGRIRGTVKDAEGQVVTGIDVRARGPQWTSTSVLDDGTFELEGLKAGDYRVSAQGSWWGDKLRKPGATDDDADGEPVTVKAGDVAEIDLVIESRKGEIRGTVVDEAGGPLADAYLSVTRESDSKVAAAGVAKQRSHWGWGRDPIVSDVDGRFVARDLVEGTYTIRAYRKGGGEGFVEGAEVGGSVEIRIEVEGSVSGTVALADGGVVQRFHVTVSDRKAGFRRNESFAQTDGAWAVREVPAGTYEVLVTAAEGTAEQKDVTIAAGEDREGIALTIEGLATIRGRVVALETGEPIAGLVVQAARTGGWFAMGGGKHGKEVTTADGTYEVENAPSGKVTLFTMPLNFMDWETIGRGSLLLEAKAGTVVEAPDILVPPQRVGRGEQTGDLGFALQQAEPGAEPGNHPKVVGLVRPGGPATGTDLKVGDVIVAVDGHDVTGANTGLYAGLTTVTAGTTIELGLEDGRSVSITAGPPI